jgi:hypothetical protein
MDRKWYSALEIPHILECWETLGIDEESISKAKQAAINPLLNLNFRDVKPENFVAFVDNDRNKPRSLETVPIDHKSVIPGQLAILLFSNVTSFENTAPEFMIRNMIVPTIQGGRMYQFTITALQILYFGGENTMVWAFKNAYSVEYLSSETPNGIEGFVGDVLHHWEQTCRLHISLHFDGCDDDRKREMDHLFLGYMYLILTHDKDRPCSLTLRKRWAFYPESLHFQFQF